jgi:D-amino-acid dehydrogenase
MKHIIVVGAGILGASTAFHLAKLGAKVTLIDRCDVGQATDAAAGIVCPWLSQRRNKAWYQLAKGGARYYPFLVKQLEELEETETGYKKVGALSLHTDYSKLEKMAERALKRREEAPEIGEITILTPAETKKLFPPLNEEYGSVFVSGGARVNGRAIRDSLINASVKLGVSVLKGDASLVMSGQKVTGVKVNGHILDGEMVVVAGGVWANELLAQIGVEFKVTPQKAQIIHLEMPGMETGNWPVIMPPNDQYILTFDHGRVVIGATHEDEAGYDHRVTAGGINEVLGKALAVAPGLSDSTILETRVGFRPFTPGFLPVLGWVPSIQGLLISNGLGASGLTSGPYIGAELAKLALDMETEIDVSLYDIAGAIEK